MKIALINENSQNSKNPMIEAAFKMAVESMSHTVFNYGMYADAGSKSLTYVQGTDTHAPCRCKATCPPTRQGID